MAFDRILVTGASGMLGQDLVPYLQTVGYQVNPTTSANLNLLANQDEIDRKLSEHHPQMIIHSAAYTAVDEAESNPELAMAINKDGTRKLALAAQAIGAVFVYISTDFVFDGDKQTPYTPIDKPNPLSVYGTSKYYGELMISELLEEYYIIRTSWLYGTRGKNFVQFILESAKAEREITVATDVHGTPSWTGSLSASIERIMNSGEFGIYHASDAGIVSRYEQAITICRLSGLPTRHIRPCRASDLALAAKRPSYSPLDCGSLPVPDWEASLQNYLEQYNAHHYEKTQ